MGIALVDFQADNWPLFFLIKNWEENKCFYWFAYAHVTDTAYVFVLSLL